MLLTLDGLRAEFGDVCDGNAVASLLKKYGFSDVGVPQSARDNLGTTGAVVEGVQVRLAYRWYDPSGPFQNAPDIHRLRLEIAGKVWGERSFEDV